MKEKRNLWLPILLVVVFALTRLPGLLPLNFSAAYALVFCAGVFLPAWLAWSMPLGVMLITDIALNLFYYHVAPVNAYTLVNYGAFAAILGLGRLFQGRRNWLALLGGGLLGAILFYIITNSVAWLQNPGYVKTLSGWIQALTTGIPGYPPTWTFFRNTLLSGGLFTGLFVGALKLGEWLEPAEEHENQPAEEAEEAKPEEGKA